MLNACLPNLPVHPSKLHPLTGDPIVAIHVARNGRIFWPVMGAAEGDGGDGSGGGGQGGGAGGGSGDGSQGGAGGSGGATGNGAGQQSTNAIDEQGNDLGYPKDTPWTEMNDKQATAYWRHQAKRHEGRVKGLVGDRTPDDVKKDLDAYAELKKQQMTPADQALTEAREQGKAEATAAERTKSATAIFRGALEANGVIGADLDEMVTNFNVASYITDDGVDTTKITNFAKKFSPGKGQQEERRRDFGGGQRRESQQGELGAAGRAESQRRFKKTTAGE